MHAGIVIGRVWATMKVESTEKIKMLLLQPTTWERKPVGDPIVAADAVGAGAGEFVFYVKAREAAVAFGGKGLDDTPPYDATILGIIDGVQLE
ncbi:MAG: EutN/CcmL family microcompartment protein [Elusimicrobia bacterium]|nr:EutN/CcmL family microcompartment protein [Elusimicrobiota bacterium]